MKKRRLFTPGPTPLIPAAQQAMAAPLLHHRTTEFQIRLANTRHQLQEIFKTVEPVLILTSSGTGAMESSVAGLIGPGQRALAVVAGKFGERWLEICQRHGVACTALTRNYGCTVTPDEVAEATHRAEADVVLLQGCETSTATTFDIEGISSALRKRCPDVLIVVDAITAIGAQPLAMDDWGLDVVISGGQKGFAAPPGLAFIALSRRAQGRLQQFESRTYYLDLKRELAGQPGGKTAYTPAVTLVAAVEAATREMLDQGLTGIIEEAELMARATRSALTALDFELVSEQPANAVTAVFPPEGVEADRLRATLDEGFGIKVAGGQGPLKGRVIRIAHLGYLDQLDVVTVTAAVELSLVRLGRLDAPGRGVAAALRTLQQQEAPCPAS